MITRRAALQQIVLTSGAIALATPSLNVRAQAPAKPTEAGEGVFKLPPLGYDYDALEPHIDAETMKIHHDKHHAAYVAKLNQAVAKAPGLEKKSVEQILQNLEAAPEAVRKDLRNQGGGHANHTLFWQTLKKNENGKPTGELAKAIDKAFGSFTKFQEQFGDAAGKVFGSGWAWLVWRNNKLAIESTSNQDSPLMTGATPLLGIDVWEHAYYLKYQNRRPEYVKAFQNVVNWDFVSERFSKAGQA
jgi:Fe-Mn family superoxide dismutase